MRRAGTGGMDSGSRVAPAACHAVALVAVLAASGSQAAPERACPPPRAKATTATVPTSSGTTWHVRADGGSATQCTGRSDAPYPGSGSAQACAWNNLSVALPNKGTRRIAGGDTIIIGAGTYQIGSGGYMQPIPSGTSSARTRILGKDGTTPRLVGVGGTHRVINMDGSSNVEIGNLEITDNSDCVHKHSNAKARCTDAMQWARVGVYARNSNNVWLHDLDIHGMGKNAFNAGDLSDWTLERVKMNRNGSAGWDGNVGSDGSNSGTMTMRDIEIAWNGCGERVSTGEPWACWAQSTGGYGDGFGTTDTGGKWLIEDAFVHHNTSDGLDLRYMDGADGTSVTMRRVYSVANAGNQVKIKGNSLVENSVMVGHCTYFRGKYNMVEGDLCRAYGSTLLLILTGNDTATVRHNTIAGEGDAQIAYGEGTSSDRVYVQNNVVVGFPYYRSTSSQTLMAGGSAPASKSFSGNMGWKVASCPSGTTCSQDPKLTNMTLASFDAEPLSGSPVVDKAPLISSVTTDFLLGKRPTGAANDVGAYEFGAGAPAPSPDPTPSCTRAAPTLAISGSTATKAPGTRNPYTISVKNNDSSGCSSTSFALARTVPSGWLGSLSATSIALAPGASGTATLTVTSPETASPGEYAIGAGTSSAAGSIHTRSASSQYSVGAGGLTETVYISKRTYEAGEKVRLSSRVLKAGVPVSGAKVVFTILKPNQVDKLVINATTNSQGMAYGSFKAGTASSSIGTYTLTAVATSGTSSDTASTWFEVTGSASAGALTESVYVSKRYYDAGEAVNLASRVLKGGVPVAGARVVFTALKPNKVNKVILEATTNAQGWAYRSFTSGTGSSSIGTYALTAAATSGTSNTSANTWFSVSN